MEKFSEACVIASTHTVVLVQNAFEAHYLPRRNPFVMYFLFAAALILMSNEFALLYLNVAADQCIRNAITIMAYCAESDPQASRLLYILSTFRDVIVQQRDQRARQQQSANQLPPFNLKANVNPYGSQFQHQATPGSARFGDQAGITLPSVTNVASVGSLNGNGHITSSPLNPHAKGRPQTAGMNLPSVSFPPSLSPFSASAHTSRPLEPSLTSPAPPNPLSPHPTGMQTPTLGSLERQLSFSNIFDLSNLGGDRLSVIGSEESNGPDEHIDFDALWAWSNATPAVGSPKLGPNNDGHGGILGGPSTNAHAMPGLQAGR
jgi:hypothetical protein